MTDVEDANARARRIRSGARAVRPLLTSPRLVQLMMKIGMLAVTKPDAMPLVEQLVEQLARRPVQAEMCSKAQAIRRSG